MKDKVLHGQLEKRMKEFYDSYFDKAPQNEFEALLPAGTKALPVLLDALDSGETDSATRTDALIAIGRIFRKHGPTSDSLDLVVKHAKSLAESGFTSERQAALFAMGNSRSESLVGGFMPLLESKQPDAINIACYLMGYAKWGAASEVIARIATDGELETVKAATWALGQIKETRCVDTLIELLQDEARVELAVESLANAGNKKALKPLSRLLGHSNVAVRLGAAHGIRSALIDNKEILLSEGVEWIFGPLRQACRDESAPVAVFAMLSLAEMGQKIDPALASAVLGIKGKPESRRTR